ncbi:MAG: hypothetical protein FJY11_05395 [Bacteroidetes bacterium]|nr:hypothetical protein [Bacteroidota bacterium]
MTKSILFSAALLLLVTSCSVDRSASWQIAENPLITEWSLQIDPEKPWNIYPRPAMARREWLNLNGLWDYAITGIQPEPPAAWEGKILVPYPVESALSGVKRRVYGDELIWYRTSVRVPSKWKGKRILLNFEASDWETKIWVNGSFAGSHRGGYDPFSFDITDLAEAGKTADVIVSVWDPTDLGPQPRGKQVRNPGGIWYTPSSGIWQTVWMEPVNESYIKSFRIFTSVDDSSIEVVPEVADTGGGYLLMTVSKNGKILGSARSTDSTPLKVIIRDAIFWRPDNPYLYDLKLELIVDGAIKDAVNSVTGIRKISLGKTEDGYTRILLNNEFIFQNGPLDQGFWPDGLYTPPSEEAMIYDLWMTKKMGFNMLRKHVKVENRVFYNWCDKIGLLVWQDMPSGDSHISGRMPDLQKDPEADAQFRYELERLIVTKFNHPSIVIWVPFNEGWGQYDTEGITDLIKEIDPTRLVNSASGWTDRGTGDILDIHNYPDPRAPQSEENRATVLGEFGGLGLAVENHTWEKRTWGYRNMAGTEELLSRYEYYYSEIGKMVVNSGLSAVVYTQTTDVETETNGLLTYDRKIDKMGAGNVFKAHMGFIPPSLLNTTDIFIDTFALRLSVSDSSAIIRYTTGGREPGSSSPVYRGPVLLTQSTTVATRAFYGQNSSRIANFEIVKAEPLPASDLSEILSPGLRVSVYEGSFDALPEFDSLTHTRQEISGFVTHELAGVDNRFCLVFDGYVRIHGTGVYGFILTSDDGSRLYINDQLVTDNDGIHGMIEKSGFIALREGLHKFRLEFFQRTGGVGLKLELEYPGGTRNIASPDMFFHISNQ